MMKEKENEMKSRDYGENRLKDIQTGGSGVLTPGGAGWMEGDG